MLFRWRCLTCPSCQHNLVVSARRTCWAEKSVGSSIKPRTGYEKASCRFSSTSIIRQQTGGDLWKHAGPPTAEESPFVWPDVYSQCCTENEIKPLGKLRENSQMIIKENKAPFQSLLKINILIGGSESVQKSRLFVSPITYVLHFSYTWKQRILVENYWS